MYGIDYQLWAGLLKKSTKRGMFILRYRYTLTFYEVSPMKL